MSDKKFKVTITGFESSDAARMFAAWAISLDAMRDRRTFWKKMSNKIVRQTLPAPNVNEYQMTHARNWKVKVNGDDI